MQPEQLPVPEDLGGKLGRDCARGDRATAAGLSRHRAENAVSVAEPTVSAPWRCSPCLGALRDCPRGRAIGGCAGALWSLSIVGLCPLPRASSGRAQPSLPSFLGCRGSLHLLTPSSEGGCWVLGTCGSSPAGCIFMPGSLIETGTSVAAAWLPTPSSLSAAGLFSSVGPAASLGCCGAGCPAPGCPMGPAHPDCWAQPELLPARQHPTQSTPPPQHPCVASSVARLGLGGDMRVQEGVGEDPMTLSNDLPPTPAPRGLL